jgi:hypothetical protein
VDNRLTIFTPRILLVHDDSGQLRLSHEELAAYDEAKRRIGDCANEAFGYRGKMIESSETPFKCRSGSRYLYIHEFESSSTRRRTAMPTVPSAAPEPPPRRTSGAPAGPY